MASVKDIISLIEKGVSKDEEELITKAYNLSLRAHEGQKRMSGEPFFVHPFEIGKILASMGMDAETISAGLMHDVLEDTKVTEEEIGKEFGPEILFLVNGVTELKNLKYRGHERHVESLRKFFIAIAKDLRVVIIKFADRLHNLRTLQYMPEAKQKRIAIESIEVYAPLANRLGMWKLKGEIEDAAFPFAYPKEYAQTEEIIAENKVLYEKNLSEVKKELEKQLEKNNNKKVITSYRMKHKYSLWKKLVKRDMDMKKIHDMVALRIIVENIEECYRVLGIIHSLWKPLPGRIKDFIAIPKPNGYRSIHTTVFIGGGGVVEIQIRTPEMHQEASYGMAAHFAYKEKMKDGNKLKLKWLEELKGLSDELHETDKYFEQLKTDFFSDRMFIFTPEGDVIDLPKDSSVVDFAYAIHSDIGDHVAGAKINGKMSQIFSKLKTRDIVEIITKDTAHPSSKWLEHTKTTLAKKRIRSYLEDNSLLKKLKSMGRS